MMTATSVSVSYTAAQAAAAAAIRYICIRGGPQKMAPFLYALTVSNINRFSKLFRYQNQEKICNNTITKDHITPQACRYTTL